MEKVLCISRENLEKIMGKPLPQGSFLSPEIEKVLSLPLKFIPKDFAETDPNFKQIIPYQIFSCKNTFFVYQRGKKIGESRLSSKYSIGIGGHINYEDYEQFLKTPYPNNILGFYKMALLREREEEVSLVSLKNELFLGWINDDTEPVGQVHIGAVHLCNIDESCEIDIREKESLSFIGWWSISEILENSEKFEKWSILATRLLLTSINGKSS